MERAIAEQLEAIEVFEAKPGQIYNVDTAAYLAGVSRRELLLYCRAGVVRPQMDPEYGALLLDERSIQQVRRAETFRRLYGMNLEGVRMVFDLMDEVEDLRRELRFLSGS